MYVSSFRQVVAAVLEVPEDQVDMESKFSELGGDSLMVMELQSAIADDLSAEVHVSDLFNKTLQEIHDELAPASNVVGAEGPRTISAPATRPAAAPRNVWIDHRLPTKQLSIR